MQRSSITISSFKGELALVMNWKFCTSFLSLEYVSHFCKSVMFPKFPRLTVTPQQKNDLLTGCSFLRNAVLSGFRQLENCDLSRVFFSRMTLAGAKGVCECVCTRMHVCMCWYFHKPNYFKPEEWEVSCLYSILKFQKPQWRFPFLFWLLFCFSCIYF